MTKVGCVNVDGNHSGRLAYPYVASADREVSILDGLPKVSIGMSVDEVRSILGVPDEVNPTYNSIHAKAAKKIGYSLVYIIQRNQETGSVVEKDEKLVRIHFGLDDKVSRIIHVGIPVPLQNEEYPQTLRSGRD